MAKYSKLAQKKVKKAVEEKKKGTLKTGTGKKVTSRKQAIAIGLSEARSEGARVPKKKKSKSASKSKSAKSATRKKGTATKKKSTATKKKSKAGKKKSK